MRSSVLVLFLAACSPNPPVPPDSGPQPRDVADVPVMDAQVADAQGLDVPAIDAGTPLDVPAIDAGTPTDVGSPSDAGAHGEARWGEIVAMPGTWIYRARDAYKDTAQTMRVANGDEVASFRALGTSIPSVNNVAGVANLEFMGGFDFQSSVNPVWYASFGHKPTFVNRGGSDEYVRFVNGLPTNYETQPGSLTPAQVRGQDFHVVHVFRTMPGSAFEGILAAIGGYKDRAGNGNQLLVTYNGTDLVGTTGKVTRWGEDNIVELKYKANGDVEIMLNGEVVLTGNLPTLPTTGFIEFVLGTNSHVVSNHFRAIIMRRGGFFNATELATIREVTNELWPRGRKPNFPHLDGQWRNNWMDWNGTTKTWQPGVGTFTGGNGTAGTHTYQWYYWIDPGATSTWPRNNVLDYHLPFPGPQGRNAALRRTDYEAGNAFGNTVVFANPGQSKVKIMRVVTPVDSAGTQGEPLAGQWAVDESP